MCATAGGVNFCVKHKCSGSSNQSLAIADQIYVGEKWRDHNTHFSTPTFQQNEPPEQHLCFTEIWIRYDKYCVFCKQDWFKFLGGIWQVIYLDNE